MQIWDGREMRNDGQLSVERRAEGIEFTVTVIIGNSFTRQHN